MQMKTWSLALCALGLAAGIGCGGDDGQSSGTNGSTGKFKGDGKINSLTVAQQTALCKDLAPDYLRVLSAMQTILCTHDSKLADPKTCDVASKECAEGFKITDDVRKGLETDCELDPTREDLVFQCPEANVDDMRACIKALATGAEEANQGFTCTKSTEFRPPEACRKLGSTCEGLSADRDIIASEIEGEGGSTPSGSDHGEADPIGDEESDAGASSDAKDAGGSASGGADAGASASDAAASKDAGAPTKDAGTKK